MQLHDRHACMIKTWLALWTGLQTALVVYGCSRGRLRYSTSLVCRWSSLLCPLWRPLWYGNYGRRKDVLSLGGPDTKAGFVGVDEEWASQGTPFSHMTPANDDPCIYPLLYPAFWSLQVNLQHCRGRETVDWDISPGKCWGGRNADVDGTVISLDLKNSKKQIVAAAHSMTLCASSFLPVPWNQ